MTNTTDLDLLARTILRLAQRLGVANPLPGDADAQLLAGADDDLAQLAADVTVGLHDAAND